MSIVIPARQEIYLEIDLLYETVQNLLENTTETCQIICILDGYWPLKPLPVHPRVTVVHHNQSIGQRAATNEGARIATGEWICKMDAHCAVDKDFDVKLIEGAQPHWTIVGAQYNLLAFNWRCNHCGNLHDQGPQPNRCEKCRGRRWTQQKLWIPRDGREGSDGKGGRRNSLTHSWRFDSNLDFQYFGAYTADEKHAKKHKVPFRLEAQEKIHDTMSLLGACWAMTRKRYFEIEPCDESFGSWGDMGTELSCKTWLSGGELKCNTTTWFAHFFRVGGLGFPYPDGGRKERAKARGKALWLTNSWPKQIYPLSWLVEKFRPLPDWHSNDNPTLALVNEAAVSFSRVHPITDSASSTSLGVVARREQVPTDTVGASGLTSTGVGASKHVLLMGNQSEMDGVDAPLGIAGVIDNQDRLAVSARNRPDGPSVHDAVKSNLGATVADSAVSVASDIPSPDPAFGIGIDSNPRKDSCDLSSSQVRDGEVLLGSHDSVSETGLGSGPEPRVQRDSGPSIITRKPRFTCLLYTCNSHDKTLELACRNNLKRATNGYEIGVVALQRTDFGDWSIVIDQPKGPLTMHQQILAGLERSTADYVFFCENDVLYHPSHFEFVPPDDTKFYYNTNVWRVRYNDGYAIRTTDCKQLSGLCAGRRLLLEHYRKRVERICVEGFNRRNGYEPGTRKLRHGGYDDVEAQSWQSPFPNLDIKDHGATVTKGQWSVDDFRNKKFAEGWEESTGRIEPWPLFYGRLQEWLKELADG